jgi:hypothetical protein
MVGIMGGEDVPATTRARRFHDAGASGFFPLPLGLSVGDLRVEEAAASNPRAQARVRFFLTDPTPVEEFYLIQEPRLLMAGGPRVARSVAAR